MIQRLTDKYIDDVIKIWLNENLNAHDFIDKDYFIKNYDIVREMLPKAEVYICKENKNVIGFIGIDNGYIAGLFVSDKYKRKGIGVISLVLQKTNMRNCHFTYLRKITML